MIDWKEGLSAETYNSLKKGDYKITILGKWRGISEATEIGTLTVKVTETKLTLSIKQTAKVNLFYTEIDAEGGLQKLHEAGWGALSITAQNAEVEEITYSGSDFTTDHAGNISLRDEAMGKTAKQLSRKMSCEVSFKGYRETYTVKKDIQIAFVTTKPKIKASLEDKTIYTALGKNSNVLTIFNDTDKQELTPNSDINVTVASNYFDLVQENEKYVLKAKNGIIPRNEKVTIQVQQENWASPISVKISVQVTTNKPAAALAGKTMTLNSELWKYDQAEREIGIKNVESADIIAVGIQAKNTNAKNNVGVMEVKFEEGVLKAALLQKDVKAGSYQYTLTPYVSTGNDLIALDKITCTIAVVKKKAAVTVKAKGSIDLLQRDSTEVVYTPTLKYITGKIEDAALIGEDASLFEISAMDENGAVNVKQQQCALTAIDEGNIALRNGIKLQSPVNAVIETVELTEGLGIFELADMSRSDTGEVDFALRIKEDAFKNGLTVQAGKTYTVKLQVFMKGRNKGNKAQQISFKVKITS